MPYAIVTMGGYRLISTVNSHLYLRHIGFVCIPMSPMLFSTQNYGLFEVLKAWLLLHIIGNLYDLGFS